MDIGYLKEISHRFPVLLYDGLCPLCHFMVKFVAKRDKKDVFRFHTLEGLTLTDCPDSVMLIRGGKILSKSEAVTDVLSGLGGFYLLPARLIKFIPTILADRMYDYVARQRRRWFGSYDSCPVPPAEILHKFL